MQIYILYNDFDYLIERASCDGQKMREMADAYNGEFDLGPYCVIPIELEDVTQQAVKADTKMPRTCEICGANPTDRHFTGCPNYNRTAETQPPC